jgi:hypothetical protein
VRTQLSVRGDAALGGDRLGLRLYKGELSPFSLTSNQSRLNSWGLKRCVHTSFFPDRIAGVLVGSLLQTGGRFFCFAGFSEVVGFKMSDQGDFWGDPKGKSELISRGEKRRRE